MTSLMFDIDALSRWSRSLESAFRGSVKTSFIIKSTHQNDSLTHKMLWQRKLKNNLHKITNTTSKFKEFWIKNSSTRVKLLL
jgi:hypothetical protein